MNEKDIDENVFRSVIEYFLRERKNKNMIEKIWLEKVSDYHCFTRIAKVRFIDKTEKKFIVKILGQGERKADKSVKDIIYEIAVLKKIKRLGFSTRDYLFVQDNINNPVKVAFSVSTYLEGVPLSDIPLYTTIKLIPKVLDIIYSLHSKTVSNYFGYLSRRTGSQKERKYSFAEFESRYLLADIERENIILNRQEKKDLMRAINSLNEANLFCLCHCDVTLSNIIWNDPKIYLIDWTYSHFTEPAFDLAYIIFWMLDFGFLEEAKNEIRRSFERYHLLGFDIVPRFLFYLAYKCFEFGRFQGIDYVKKGKQLLQEIPSLSLEDLLSSVTKVFFKKPLK